MSEGFRISKDLVLPLDASLWTFADLAIKGAGKSYAACVLAEEMIANNIPIIAIDGIGIWWGLRVGVNEKGEPDPKVAGLPIVVFGGQHKDLSIPSLIGKHKNLVVDEQKLQLMVKSILEAGISVVLDTSEFSKNMQRRIVAIFINELYHLNAPYGTRHVFIEEADLWIPQRIVGDVAFSAGAIDDLVRRGGNFNLGCTLISQRHAVVNKDVLSQTSCLMILRTIHDLDKKAVRAWVDNVAKPNDPKIRKWYDGLRELADGECWIWHPTEPYIFKKIQFRKRRTLHATREFFRRPQAKKLEMMDVSEFVEKFKNVFEPKPHLVPEKATYTPPKLVATPFGPRTSPSHLDIPIEPPIEVKSGEQFRIPMPTRSDIERAQEVANPSESMVVQVRKPTLSVETRKPTLEASDRDVVGRVLYAIMQGSFDERQTLPKAVGILANFGWAHDKREVENTLVQLCDLKFFTRKISTGNLWWFRLTPDAKNRIRIVEVNAT